jgi:hypothetical protein
MVCAGRVFLGLQAQSLHLEEDGPDFGKFRMILGYLHVNLS